MIQRRSFLAGIIATGVASLVVKAGVLMPIKPRLVGDGVALFSVAHPNWDVCHGYR